MVNIKGLKKSTVLIALYNEAQVQGMGIFAPFQKQITEDEAEEMLKRSTYFDYLNGRVMKIDLKSDEEFEEWLYDRDNGSGSAQRIIDELRNSQNVDR
jgi:hypothetical protein